jgi:two-component system, cell cycle sensor histidine kinase and response regulator CckA
VLAGGVAHDFNNLLTGLMAQASLVQKKLPADSPLQSHLDKILNITRRATDLTHQLLTYAGKTKARVETLDLNELIEQNAGLLETMLPLQSLFTELHPGPIMVKADRGQLQQLIMNLIINAAEAIKVENGRVTIKTSLVYLDAPQRHRFSGGHTLAAGQYVCLEVIDNGIGMDQATLSRIFDPFFTTKPHGHGLGLSATMGIVRSQNGALQVESEPDQGTRFLVWLPVDAAAQPDREDSEDPDRHDVSGLILLVDDEAPVREAVVDILQAMGINAITAADGREGMALFEQHRDEITAVLLDMQMPVMDGKAMLKAIRQVDQTKPVILSSGYSETELSGLLQHEVTFFLQKPYNMSQLLNMITAVAGR